MKSNKVIVAVGLEPESRETLKKLRDLELPLESEIHLVHVVPVIIYARGMDFSAQTYPMKEERPAIRDAVISQLKIIRNEILPLHQKIVYECLFDASEKAIFTDYVKEVKGDLVVVATRSKHGIMNFFDSSFAQHQVKHSPANLLILR